MIKFSNCKINIGLEIVSKRTDNYHNIESVFYPIPLKDIVEMVPNAENNFNYTQSGIIVDAAVEDNLLYKAWKLIDEEYKIGGVNVHLHKQIPMGAGLGGGSANAAILLKMLNEEFKLSLSTKKLESYAAVLGSDCPFFIEAKSAFVYNTGTDFYSIDLNLEGYYLVLIKPEIHISTQEAYSEIELQKSNINLNEINKIPIGEWKGKVYNRFENHIFKLHPQLKDIKKELYNMGAVYASMSGSGSSIYGIFEKEPDVEGFDGSFVKILGL
jgi:4-diphosphocytidyl-2-C-methyl-D-erythritol kinase